MSKKNRDDKESLLDDSITTINTIEELKEKKTMDTKEETKSEPVVEPNKEPLISFSQWFRLKVREGKYKLHWEDGLRAYCDTSLRRTKSDWETTFKNY